MTTIPSSSNQIVEQQLDGCCENLQGLLKADVYAFDGPILHGADVIIRDAIEERLANARRKSARLALMLETPGGYIEVTQRIADTLRRHYRQVEFIVPDYAMSAGTILVMSGDVIRMDYFAVLGPIDPQVTRPGSDSSVPALGYLAQYERLIEKSKRGMLTTAEMAFLIEKFDPAELYSYEQARDLSITLLKEWLVKYKFKDWKRTETRRRPVTLAMKRKRAEDIAKKLNDTKKWHSHGRGINMDVLQRDVKLKIDDFGVDKNLNRCIRSYHRLMNDYMMRRGHSAAIHTVGQYGGVNG